MQLKLQAYPKAVSLLRDLYRPFPVVDNAPDADELRINEVAESVLAEFADALGAAEKRQLWSLFYEPQAFYRDTVALTYHYRTFAGVDTVVAALRELAGLRRPHGFKLNAGTTYMQPSPSLSFIHLMFTFETRSPPARCCGKMSILPVRTSDQETQWKIWSMSTWIDELLDHPEDEALLRIPAARRWKAENELTTDVVIIGGGNTGLTLAARLKALGIDYVVVDENEQYGDNWAKRYDCLRFHVPKSFCAPPYTSGYPAAAPEELRREDLADMMRHLGTTHDLDVIHQTRVTATNFDDTSKVWTLQVASAASIRTLRCRHLVVATGMGSWAPYTPPMANSLAYTGVTMHSHHFKNARVLAEQGIKSAVVVGSANTAFDIMEDCYKAGLTTTMIQRSPTFLIPLEYLHDPNGLGIYKHVPAAVADGITMSGPVQTDCQLLRLTHAKLAIKEPNRYEALAEAGFQVLDSTQGDLSSNLLERAGGHFVDVGDGVSLLSSGRVVVRSGVTPTGYTPTGIALSDGTTIDAQAIIFCTGFRDTDMRLMMPEVLGRGGKDVAERMEPIWGLDSEGESRGLYKRHAGVEHFWVCGYGATHQRWGSRMVARMIKAELAGLLPTAYRGQAAESARVAAGSIGKEAAL